MEGIRSARGGCVGRNINRLILFLLLFSHAAISSCLTSGFSSRLDFHKDTGSLSDLLSSPGRYANALNMTVGEVAKAKEHHRLASERLHHKLQSNESSGTEKHTLMCQHRFQYGRHPFACRQCWSYQPVCVCGLAGPRQRPLPPGLEVVVWTHHQEWGKTSNTGGVLALTLENCRLLMKGLPEHDAQLEELFLLQNDEDCFPVVLWPDQRKQTNDSKESAISTYVSLDVVQRAMKDKTVVLIAVDGTWRNARRMVSRLPSTVPRLDLSVDMVREELDGVSPKSLLAPLRTLGPSDQADSERQVCTSEAVVGALLQLGLAREDGQHVLDIARTKIDLVRRYRGKV